MRMSGSNSMLGGVGAVSCWLLLGLLATGCASSTDPAPPVAPAVAPASGNPASENVMNTLPEDSRWRLVESTIVGLEAGNATGIRLEFKDGRLSGDSGCNRFSADAELDDGALRLGPVMSTKRGCADPRGAVESALYAALPGIRQVSMEGDRLRLAHVDGGAMWFEADPTVSE